MLVSAITVMENAKPVAGIVFAEAQEAASLASLAFTVPGGTRRDTLHLVAKADGRWLQVLNKFKGADQ